MSETQELADVKKRFVQYEDMDEAALASLVNGTLDQARAASTRVATWLVVGNGAALTLCYQTMLSMGEAAPFMLSPIAACFALGLILAFVSFLTFQASLIATYQILETIHLTSVAQRLGLSPPSPADEKSWKRLKDYQNNSSGFLIVSAACFMIGALAPAAGVLDPEFLDVFDFALGASESVPVVAPPPS